MANITINKNYVLGGLMVLSVAASFYSAYIKKTQEEQTRKSFGDLQGEMKALQERFENLQATVDSRTEKILLNQATPPEEHQVIHYFKSEPKPGIIPDALFKEAEKCISVKTLKDYILSRFDTETTKFEISDNITKKELVSILRGIAIFSPVVMMDLEKMIAEGRKEKA